MEHTAHANSNQLTFRVHSLQKYIVIKNKVAQGDNPTFSCIQAFYVKSESILFFKAKKYIYTCLSLGQQGESENVKVKNPPFCLLWLVNFD